MRALLLILFALLSFPAFSSSYIKVANNGTDLPESALLGSGPTDWACTRDNTSGLLWEVKTTDGGLRDMNKGYTNYDDPTQAQKQNGSGFVNPTQAEIDDASNSIGLINAVNGTGLCGFSDWKMPSKDELSALVDTSHAPTINPTFFPNTPNSAFSSGFWSGSPYASYSNRAWGVNFFNGVVGYGNRYYVSNVRLVRGGQSLGTFSLSLSASGIGSGSLASSIGGLNCGSTAGTTSGICSANFASGTTVTLTAAPAIGSTFTGWSGACSGTSASCTLTMDAAKSVTAGFAAATSRLGLLKNVVNTGGGTATAAQFTLTASGPTVIAGPAPVAAVNAPVGVYTLSESNLANYAAGSYSCSGGGTLVGNRLTIGVADAGKTITCTVTNTFTPSPLSQTITFGPAPSVTVGGTGTVSASASSGLPVTMTSSTLGICTLSGNTVRGIAAGLCTLAANQAGNSSFSPAAQALSSFSIAAAPLPPGPPTPISITAGRGSATLIFSAPSGSAIARYTASCAASGQTTRAATGSASPLTVRNLSGGVQYQCTLTATDSSGSTSVASAAQPVTPAAGKNSLTPILMLLLD